ncbi:MAG: CDP-diacylglycerol--glycerol-3-phosphate 3-phosphatidyltransferase [Planctomycetota bacterium]|nr:MAG: CDP-diacylglycerol--glycerol-3-phosphate 3-phosphatidyltransferase [Planctomycetota bacterium]
MAATAPTTSRVWTVPNILSLGRLLLSVFCFFLVERQDFKAATVVFLLAATTDWIDGWYARRFNQVSRLGRILDPLVDKVLICGVFILIAARGGMAILPWMAVVVVVRELVVTAVRAEMERAGCDFSAGMAGKLKMVLQCAAVGLELGRFGFPQFFAGTDAAAITGWVAMAAVVLTAYSGAEYVVKAWPVITAAGPPQVG